MRLLSATLVLITASSNALACSCVRKTADPQEIEARAQWADAVFVGIARSSYQEVLNNCSPGARCVSDEQRIFSVEPIEPIFGVSHDPVEVATATSGASCGMWLRLGEPYLIYAHRDTNGTLMTGLCSAHLANGEIESIEIDYLVSNRDRYLKQVAPDGQSVESFLDNFFKEEVAAYEIDIRVNSFLWHDLDNDGHDELVAYFETQFQSPPPNAGAWIRKHRPGITVFHRSGDSLLDIPPTWIKWCDEHPEYTGQLTANAGELVLHACDGKQLKLVLVDGNLKGGGWSN